MKDPICFSVSSSPGSRSSSSATEMEWKAATSMSSVTARASGRSTPQLGWIAAKGMSADQDTASTEQPRLREC